MRAYLFLLIAVALSPFFACTMPGPEPPPIQVKAPTPASIKRELAWEHKQKQYAQGTRVAARIFRTHGCATTYAGETARAAIDNGVPVSVIAALIVVESTCRPSVISSEGAVGLMQVVPKVWHMKAADLKDPVTNIRKGTEILASFTRESGLLEGLHRYNGLGVGCSSCDPTYRDRVLVVAGYYPREEL